MGYEYSTTFYVLLGVQIFSTALMLFAAEYVFGKLKNSTQRILFFYCGAAFINNIGYLMEMLSTNKEEYLMATKMSYIGRVWLPYALFIFTLNVCHRDLKKHRKIILAAIHSAVLILVFTSDRNTLYYNSMDYVQGELFPYIIYGHGIAHTLYFGLIAIYIMLGLTFLFITLRKERNENSRKRYGLVLAAVFVQCVCFIANSFNVTGNYDLTFLGYSISTVFMYIAMFKYGLIDTLQAVTDFVLDDITGAVIAVNLDDQVSYLNAVAEGLFPDARSFKSNTARIIRNAMENGDELEIDGKIYSISSSKLYQGKQCVGEAFLLNDETEHMRYMAELKEQKEIAEAANESKSAFVSVVSHEIRTPMNAVVSMTELLLREPEKLDSKQKKYLTNIKNSGSALVMIVNDILDQSKIESGKMEIVEETYEIRPMTEDVRMIVEDRIGSKPIHLVYEIDESVPRYLVGDSLRIRQILINLMNNAVKFTEEGFIKLSIKSVGGDAEHCNLRFSVQDSGQGIRAEDMEKLGQAFVQVDVKKNHHKEGTGLGLSISRDFISLMGGQLEVASEYGKGTEFFFTIRQGVAEKIISRSYGVSKQAWQEEEQFMTKNATVLAVDDTEINLVIMTELLTPLGLKVDIAASGERALEMMRVNRYDLVFMDYMMPYMDGITTTEKIRALANEFENDDERRYFKSVPIVALSGDSSDKTKDSFFRAGIDDFVEKPVDLKHLKKMLIKWLPVEKLEAK